MTDRAPSEVDRMRELAESVAERNKRIHGPEPSEVETVARATGIPRRYVVIARLRDQQVDDEIIDALDWLMDAARVDRAWLLDSLDKCMNEIRELEDALNAARGRSRDDTVAEIVAMLRENARLSVTNAARYFNGTIADKIEARFGAGQTDRTNP